MKMQQHKAFTLIELMVVMAIIGILSALVIPQLARHFADEQDLIAPEVAKTKKQAADTTGIVKPAALPVVPGKVPELESLSADIQLQTGHRLDGLNVHTWYEAAFTAHFVYRPDKTVDEPVKLVFPFPTGAIGARDVSLQLKNVEGEFSEPDNVIYDLKGIYWHGEVAKDSLLNAKVTYRAAGLDRFVYRLPGSGRTPKIQIKLQHQGTGSPHVPATALQPSAENAAILNWDFNNLVTQQRHIVVELPAIMSPIGRVILLAKLAGLAVFLFGAGFWYMAEAQQPGQLNNFRWGHFLLLALTYFLFFVIFAVLMFRYQTSTLLGLSFAALLSLPLLILHVSSNLAGQLKLRFALTHVLPLAVFTLGLVVNGVYGGEYREYLYIAAAVMTMSYFTWSYPRWAAKRRAYRKTQRDLGKRRHQQARLNERQRELQQNLEDAGLYQDKVSLWLAESDDQGLQRKRHQVEKAAASISTCQTDYPALKIRLTELKLEADDYAATAKNLELELDKQLERLKQVYRQLQESMSALLSQRASQRKKQKEARQQYDKALQSALQSWFSTINKAESRDMEVETALQNQDPETLQEERTQLLQIRGSLENLLANKDFRTAVEKLKDIEADDKHSQQAQQLKRDIERQSKQVSSLLDRLTIALQQLYSQRQWLKQQASSGQAQQSHCLACGHSMPEGEFCLHCGAPQPQQLDCQHCGHRYPLSRHLSALWPPPQALYCPACGKQYTPWPPQASIIELSDKIQ